MIGLFVDPLLTSVVIVLQFNYEVTYWAIKTKQYTKIP